MWKGIHLHGQQRDGSQDRTTKFSQRINKERKRGKNEEGESNYRRSVNELQEMKDRLRTDKERENKDASAHVTASTCNEVENTLEIQVRGIIK